MKEEDVIKIKKQAFEDLRMHFVFNILNDCRYLIKNDSDKAYLAFYQLAEYLRGSIEESLMEKSRSLKAELKFLNAYLALEQLQRPGLKYEISLDETNGFVNCGEIYRKTEKLLKKYVYDNHDEHKFKLVSRAGEITLTMDDNLESELVLVYEDDSCR